MTMKEESTRKNRKQKRSKAGSAEDGTLKGSKRAEQIEGARQVEQIEGAKQAEQIEGARQVEQIQGAKQAEQIKGSKQAEQIQGAKQVELIKGSKKFEQIQGTRQAELIKREKQDKLYGQKKPEPGFWNKKPVLIFIGLIIVLLTMVITSYALFAGNHNLYTNKTTPQDFCNKCHSDKVTTMNIASNVHKNAGCICHGYNPNATEAYNINLAHNLTKNIYCTNCHTNYNISTGNITIHGGTITAPNQSAHYLINNSNKNQIYQNAKGFFNI